MQCVKLVNAGFVDRVIVFDTLPDHLIRDIQTREVSGFPRSWAKWLGEIESTRKVYRTSTEKRGPGDYVYTHTEIGKEPCFFVLNYTDVNRDKESWRRICDYLKMNCGPEVRLKEKVEEMAIPLAPNCTSPLDVEPEDVMDQALVRISGKKADVLDEKEVVMQGETILVEEKPEKKRGRPKKVKVAA